MTTLTGTVWNGVVVLDGGPALPEGAKVSVVLTDTVVEANDRNGSAEHLSKKEGHVQDRSKVGGPYSWMLKYAGVLDDMPAYFAAQHDHCIHGTASR